MFRKPFRVQSNVPCRGAERKKLKQTIALQFPTLSPQQLEDLLPQGVPLFIIRLVTFGGVVVTTYHTEGDPLFFNHGAAVCPSIYSVWRYPSIVKPVMIANQTLSKLQYGADLLLTAVLTVEEGGYSLEGFKKGDYCSLRVKGSSMFTGVGMCLVPYEKMVEYDMRIEGFRMLHFQGDLLWELGSTNTPMDTHMRTCIKAAARATTSAVIPLPETGSPTEPEDLGIPSQHIMIKDPLDEEIDPVDQYREFKEATIAALAPNHALPTEDKRAAIARALEERTRYIRTLPNPKIRDVSRKHMKDSSTAFEGLSKNPEVSLYREAQRILDDADDEIDEVGVTLPEAYQSDVSDSVHKASHYYDRLGLQVTGHGRELRIGNVAFQFQPWPEGGESGSNDDLDYELDDLDFRAWLKNSDSSKVDLDEIGISLPKKYSSKKSLPKPPPPLSPSPSPPAEPLVTPVDDVLELREELEKLMKLRTREEAEVLVGKDELRNMAVEIGRRGKGTSVVGVVEGKGEVGKGAVKGTGASVVGVVKGKGEELGRGEMDEIGISMPAEYRMRRGSSEVGPEELESEGSSSEEEEEPEGATSAAAKTWYSIPEHKGKVATPISLEDAVDMDDLMRECFLASVKSLAKSKTSGDFSPLLTSTFYRTHMLELCPSDLKLDVKKSSFKKLSKFLQRMQREGIVKLAENDKGSEVISSIDFKHPLVKGYTPCLLAGSDSTGAGNEGAAAQAKPSLKISTLYMPSHRLVSFFRQLGFTKASILDYQQVRESVLRYVKENQLVDSSNPKQVLPDPTLGDALHHRGAEANKSILRQELINMVIEEMKPAYSITHGSAAPIIKRGKLEPIKLSLVQKTGNKKATLVDNLEYYGVPASDVAQSLQKMAAASTTVNDVQGKPTARQVQVQGNAVKVIAKLLQDSYGVPVNYIEAVDKIKPPKTQKKRKKK